MSNEVSEHHLSVARTARYYTLGEPGWEQVADYALDWATSHVAVPAAAVEG